MKIDIRPISGDGEALTDATQALADQLAAQMTVERASVLALAVLDEWTKPAHHVITIVAEKDLGDDPQFRAVCSCGWRGLPCVFQSQARRDPCAVLDALQEREDRKPR